MLIAIHTDPDGPDGVAARWAKGLATRGIDICWVDLATPDAIQQIRDCDGVMWHWSQPDKEARICRNLQVIEFQLGIPVFPNYASWWHRRDKLSQYYLLQAAGVPMPKTWIFWDKQEAREWALQTDYPKIFKLSSGGSGGGVILVRSAAEANRLIDRMFGRGLILGQIDFHLHKGKLWNRKILREWISHCKKIFHNFVGRRRPQLRSEKGYVYFQEYIPENDYKTQISIIGDRAFGYIRFNRSNDFQSYGDRDYDASSVDLKCVEMAFEISRRLGSPMMAYDFLVHRNKLVVLEIQLRNGRTLGYWTRNLKRINEPMSPREAQVDAFLNCILAGKESLATHATNSLK